MSAGWQSHPVIVAIAAGSATAAAVSAIFMSVVIPTWIKDKELQIAELNQKLGSTLQIEKDNTKLKNENAALSARLLESSRDNIFSVEDAYPKGFRKVRIGDPITKINDVFAGLSITQEDDDIRVKLADNYYFSSVGYKFDAKAKVRVVKSILFHANYKVDFFADMQAQLSEKFGTGKPGKILKKDLEWGNVRGHDLWLMRGGALVINKHSG